MMPWGTLDDSLYDHPKLDALGPSRLPCVGLYVLCLSWSNRYLTDGFVPATRVQKLGGTVPLAEKLVSAGLFERVGEDYRIHDFLDFNPSSSSIRERRAAMRELGKRGGAASGQARRLNRGASSENEAERLNSVPIRSLPIPSASSEALQRDPEIQRMLDLQDKALRERGQKP
jgi:hypothetical protein